MNFIFQSLPLIKIYQANGVDTTFFTEHVDMNLQWTKDYGNGINKWLIENNYDSTGGGTSELSISCFLITVSIIVTFINFVF